MCDMTDTPVLTALLDATRLSALHTTENGRIVARTSQPDAAGSAYRTALVELTGGGTLPLTRGNASVGSVALAEDGSTFFTAKRTGEDGKDAEDAQLWALPPRGEARELATRPGGFGTLHLAGRTLVAELEVHSRAADEAEHATLAAERKDAKVTAALHSQFPTRYWDADLGPFRSVLAVAELPEDLDHAEPTPAPGADTQAASEATSRGRHAGGASSEAPGTSGAKDEEPAASLLHFRHLTMPPGRLHGWSSDKQGRFALAVMLDTVDALLGYGRLYLLDLTGEQEPRLLLDGSAEAEYWPGAFSPDGTRALVSREQVWSENASLSSAVHVVDLTTGATEQLWPEHDFWVDPVWLDEQTLVATSDDHGRGSVWIGSLSDAAPRRLAGGPEQELTFSGASVANGSVIAIASGISVAPHPVSIDTATGAVTQLPNPATALEQGGTLTEVTATAEDGTELRAWLRVPEGEGPHPLVVFAHGGPWGSWNAWTFRWNPGPFVAAGYAVLMPDPAISTGYGQHMIDRGQQELGGTPFNDIMALTDATVARADIDETRTAFAGGSYGGYMANWVAGHTGDRFRCIVTHASLWDTESMGHTTDNAGWDRPMRVQNPRYNPKEAVAEIEVPLLVIHGDRDYRVPIAQGQALWYDLNAFSATPKDADGRTRHRYLYFPDEGHWITGRGNAEVWYRTFIAFLDEHVQGKETELPSTLG